MISREQEELDDIKTALRTSTGLASENSEKDGGVEVGGIWGEALVFETRDEQSLTILSLKNSRKEVARVEEEIEAGSGDDDLRERRDYRVDHSFLGCFEHWEIKFWYTKCVWECRSGD